MPMGPPSQLPAPKSALSPVVAPMLRTYAALAAWTGSRVTSACHTLLGGRSGQPRSEVPAGGGGWLALGLGAAEADALAGGVDGPGVAPLPGASTKWADAGPVEACVTTPYPASRSSAP